MMRHSILVSPLFKTLWVLCLWAGGSQSQDTGTQDPAKYSGDGSGDVDDDDDCSMISGHSCAANGVCKYCVMCVQSSCIVGKSASTSTAAQPVCNTTQTGSIPTYDWYNYCLSSGNDSDGDYCATSSECYQYRRDANASVNYIWQNLTCDPVNCLLMTDHLRPPFPGQLPPSTMPSDISSTAPESPSQPTSGAGHHGHHHRLDIAGNRPVTVALAVTCSFILLISLVWLIRLCYRTGYVPAWLPCQPRRRTQSLTSSMSQVPSTAPPSFRSMFQRRAYGRHSSSLHSTPSITEPLPSYHSPDPPPPKYEQAIVTQIRGLQSDQAPVFVANEHTNGLPPALWLPVYYSPNHSSFSFGRLRNQPPVPIQLPSSSSGTSMWQQHGELTDPIRTFWMHHQQYMAHRQHPFQDSQRQTAAPEPEAHAACGAPVPDTQDGLEATTRPQEPAATANTTTAAAQTNPNTQSQ